jgi:short-subunit dehydrogenase
MHQIIRRLIAKKGFNVALIACGKDVVEKLSQEIRTSGALCCGKLLSQDIASTWDAIRNHYPSTEYNIRAAVFNAGYAVWKPFLDITPEEVQTSLQTNITSAFAFSREAILSFKENDIEEVKFSLEQRLV